MAANKLIRFGPAALSNAAANIVNPPTLSGGTGLSGTNTGTYVILRHIRIVNKTAGTATVSLFIGASTGSSAGTEFLGSTTTVAANSYIEWYGLVRLDVGDYLTGLASAASTLTFQAEGEIGVA
jgi:hypothetical protein